MTIYSLKQYAYFNNDFITLPFQTKKKITYKIILLAYKCYL